MRHRNHRGTKIKKLGEGTKFTFFCSKNHLQASLITKFSRGDLPDPDKKGRANGERRRKGKERGEVTKWLSEGWTPPGERC